MTNLEYISTWLRARFGDTERGASLVEYALLLALIAIICIVAIGVIGRETNETFGDVGSAVSTDT